VVGSMDKRRSAPLGLGLRAFFVSLQ
jgi:hypothetical protein